MRRADIGLISLGLVLGVVISALAMSGTAQAQDIFFGTLEKAPDGEVFLNRCDLGSTRYRLVDEAGSSERPVARLADTEIKTPTQAAVYGTVDEDKDGYVLQVMAIEDIAPGKTCHLSDALTEPAPAIHP
ncbi:hypothetical protein [Asticcacaulis sp. 201]|uniref:hypothetical protein n=1 Tax=Asticcacaulis sp. 201 TaxID=3028787 RepID=UPI00291608AA|nr:hypothetical protein [Asticcacaulis sp. 201]MDV6330171.1 hypothetical protein [Asticcacaulis sp. 201]